MGSSEKYVSPVRHHVFIIKATVLTFLVKNGKVKLSGESIFREYVKKLEVKSHTRSRPRP